MRTFDIRKLNTYQEGDVIMFVESYVDKKDLPCCLVKSGYNRDRYFELMEKLSYGSGDYVRVPVLVGIKIYKITSPVQYYSDAEVVSSIMFEGEVIAGTHKFNNQTDQVVEICYYGSNFSLDIASYMSRLKGIYVSPIQDYEIAYEYLQI